MEFSVDRTGKVTFSGILLLMTLQVSWLLSCAESQEPTYQAPKRNNQASQKNPGQQTGIQQGANPLNAGGVQGTQGTISQGQQSGSQDSQGTSSAVNIGEEPSGDQLSVSELNSLLSSWAQKAPGLLSYAKYGNVNGQDASFLRITGKSSQNLPKVMVTAATHGNEQITTTILISVFYKMISQYGKDAAITEIFDTRDVYFVPAVCPDAYENNTREADGQDPNRSFPYPGEEQGSPSKCISAIMKLFNDKKFNATIDYHAQGGMIMYPWAYQSSEVGEHNQAYKTLSKKVADAANYQWGQILDLVGESPGSSADYYHWQGNKSGSNTVALGVEVAGDVSSDIGSHLKALPIFLKDAPTASFWLSEGLAPEPPPFIPPPGFVRGME